MSGMMWTGFASLAVAALVGASVASVASVETLTVDFGGVQNGAPDWSAEPGTIGAMRVEGPEGFWLTPLFHAHLGTIGSPAARATFLAAHPFLDDVTEVDLYATYGAPYEFGLPTLKVDVEELDDAMDRAIEGLEPLLVTDSYQPIVTVPSEPGTNPPFWREWSVKPPVWNDCTTCPTPVFWRDEVLYRDSERRILKFEALLHDAIERQVVRGGGSAQDARNFINSQDYVQALQSFGIHLTVQILGLRGDNPTVTTDETTTDGLKNLDLGILPEVALTDLDEVVFHYTGPITGSWGPLRYGHDSTSSGPVGTSIDLYLCGAVPGMKLAWKDANNQPFLSPLMYASPGRWRILIPLVASPGAATVMSAFYPTYGFVPPAGAISFGISP